MPQQPTSESRVSRQALDARRPQLLSASRMGEVGIVRKLRRRRTASEQRGLSAGAFLAPAMVTLAVFTFGPVLLALFASFWQISITGDEWTFLGFDNYSEAFGSSDVRQATWNTVLYCAITIVPSVAIGLGLAILVNTFQRGTAVFRTILFLPLTANLVAMSIVFVWIFTLRGGFANGVLAIIGIAPLNFLGDATTALPTVAALGIWRSASFNMVIYLAGLTTIPTSIHESAASDGLRGWSKFRRVTWPLLRPSTVFVMVITVLQSLQVFDSISVMTQGGPLGATQTLLYLVWRIGFQTFRIGYSSALAFVVLLIIILIGVARSRALTETDYR